MARLQVTARAIPPLPAGSPVWVGQGPSGQLECHSDDPASEELVAGLLTQRLYFPGKGWPLLVRDKAGRLQRDAATGRYVLAGHVDLDGEPQQLLQALEDALEMTGQFVVLKVI